jgi:steroid delta-isomerase-like uncharacterized protein
MYSLQPESRPMTDEERKEVARRWFDAINSGNIDILDEIVDYDVIDHSGLSSGHGAGCEGHKKLVSQLRQAFSDWQSTIDDMTVQEDRVTIRHTGRGTYPSDFKNLMGTAAAHLDPEMRKMDFQITSIVRINNGKIVEHWADQGPFGIKSGPGQAEPELPGPAPSPEENKHLLQQYVQNVIDGQNPSLAHYYFAPNFYNHDPAPGEQPGLGGVTAFLQAIFSAFSGFHTTIEEQVAEEDLVVGRWSQQFTNTGGYLNFPATGKTIHIGGITITRVRDGKIVEEWEARDAVSLLQQMGVLPPLGALEGEPMQGDTTAKKALVERFFYDAWNSNNLAALDELLADDFVNHNLLSGQQPGHEGIRQLLTHWYSAFPDLSISIDLLAAEADRVAARWTLRGTHQGTFLGMAATGKYVSITGISIFGIKDERIKEMWGYWDQATLLELLGQIQWPQPTGQGSQPPQAPAAGSQPSSGSQPPQW